MWSSDVLKNFAGVMLGAQPGHKYSQNSFLLGTENYIRKKKIMRSR